MPEFAPGEAKAAIAPITVRPSGLSCEAEIFLGPDELTKVATSGRIPFTSTGVSQNVRLPVTMPSIEGTYHVYIDVYAEDYLVAAYQAIEDVVIMPALARLFGTVTDADTGAALAGVNVTLWDAAETEMLLSAFTDSGGNYSMENILPGSYAVYFSKAGYETQKR